MTIMPLDSDLRAEIKSDLKNRRGPFSHAVVATHEIVSHYRIDRIKPVQATAILRELCIRDVVARTPDGVKMGYFVVDASLAQAEPVRVREVFLKARGLPYVPGIPRPRNRPDDCALEDRVLVKKMRADFEAKQGPFAHEVVTAADVHEAYEKGEVAIQAIKLLLRRWSFQVTRTFVNKTKSYLVLYVVHDRPDLLVMQPRELLNSYRQSRGLPDV
jgi:hypothetical protein